MSDTLNRILQQPEDKSLDSLATKMAKEQLAAGPKPVTMERKDDSGQLAQQHAEAPVATPPAQTQDNSNVSATTPASVQAEATPSMDQLNAKEQTAESKVANSRPVRTIEVPGPDDPSGQEAPRPMGLAEVYQALNPYKPLTAEEVEAERKKEAQERKWAAIGDGISAMANLYFASQGAPNMFDYEKSASKNTQERWDKLRKEREDNAYKYSSQYLQYLMSDRNQANQDRNYRLDLERMALNREMSEAQNAITLKKMEEDRRQAKVKEEQWQKTFEEGARQFDATNAIQKQKVAQEAVRLAREAKKNAMTFNLGKGRGNVSIDKDALNAENISYLFSLLPEEVRSQVHGKEIIGDIIEKDANGNEIRDQISGKASTRRGVVGYSEPTTEAMLIAIGANIDADESYEVRQAFRELAGQKPDPNDGPQQKTAGFNTGSSTGKTAGFQK